jgi:hypothetical protein
MRKEEVIAAMKASGAAMVVYGAGGGYDLGVPVPIEDAIRDIEAMDPREFEGVQGVDWDWSEA